MALAMAMQTKICMSGFYVLFGEQEIQEKCPVSQKIWTWVASKSNLQEVLVADEIVLYM
jgi:hypothetical protein